MPAQPSTTTRFFLLTFAITWGLQLPGVLAQRGLLPGAMPLYLALAGLSILGPITSARGRSARARLARFA